MKRMDLSSIKEEDSSSISLVADYKSSASKEVFLNAKSKRSPQKDEDKDFSEVSNTHLIKIKLESIDEKIDTWAVEERPSSWCPAQDELSPENATQTVGGKPPTNSGNCATIAGTSYLKNTILDEVLSEKKMALLRSPQVIKFLHDHQLNKRTQL